MNRLDNRLEEIKNERSTEQWLLIAGSAASAAAAATIAFNPEGAESIFSLDTPTTSGSAGRKFRHLAALQLTGISALQALGAQEKPSSKMLAVNGGLWAAGSVLTGIHTYHTKSIKAETGFPIAAGQAILGALMIGRAIKMEDDINIVRK